VSVAPFVIAEAGVNHNGRLELALELVDAAAAAGADAVKFQTFKAESLTTRAAPLAAYQERSEGVDGAQFEMLRRLELDADAFSVIARRCSERGIEFMSTPFDVPSVDLLARLGVKRFKIPSGEATNPLLLRAVARAGKPIILSTGMCTLGEVEWALGSLGRELTGSTHAVPMVDPMVRARLRDMVTVLHCTTEYPATADLVNLRAMTTLASAFGVKVGYSDHTEGHAVSCAAVALGATVIEKHFTMDRSLPGPDHAASLEASELAGFVRAMRAVHQSLGDGLKLPKEPELRNREVARRSVVARRRIRAGEVLSDQNLTLKRPGTGIPSMSWDSVLGRVASRDYDIDELIDP
jgi:N-acetylneuraminate synthase